MLLNALQIPEHQTNWNARFEELLPTIVYNLRFEFRKLAVERQEDAVQEAVANCFVAFYRLVQQGRGELAYPTVLARYAAAQVRDGRTVGNRLNANDVSARYAQQRRGIRLLSLDRYDEKRQGWREAVVNDPRTPVFQQASFRVDFPAWLNRLSARNRQIALALAKGFKTSWVARKFRLSAARISQLRRELCSSWREFHAGPGKSEALSPHAA